MTSTGERTIDVSIWRGRGNGQYETFKVPLRDYVFGSILGLAPGILVTNLFAHQFESAIRNPGIGTVLVLIALIVISGTGGLWLKGRFQQPKA